MKTGCGTDGSICGTSADTVGTLLTLSHQHGPGAAPRQSQAPECGAGWRVIWWQAAAWLEYWPVLVQLSVSVRAASKQVWLQAERVYSALNKVLRAAAAAGYLHFTSVWLCTDSVFSAHNQTHRRGDTGRGQSWGIVTKYEEWSHEDIVRLHILHSPTAGEAGYRSQAWPRTWGRPLVTPGYLAAWCQAHT